MRCIQLALAENMGWFCCCVFFSFSSPVCLFVSSSSSSPNPSPHSSATFNFFSYPWSEKRLCLLQEMHLFKTDIKKHVYVLSSLFCLHCFVSCLCQSNFFVSSNIIEGNQGLFHKFQILLIWSESNLQFLMRVFFSFQVDLEQQVSKARRSVKACLRLTFSTYKQTIPTTSCIVSFHVGVSTYKSKLSNERLCKGKEFNAIHL